MNGPRSRQEISRSSGPEIHAAGHARKAGVDTSGWFEGRRMATIGQGGCYRVAGRRAVTRMRTFAQACPSPLRSLQRGNSLPVRFPTARPKIGRSTGGSIWAITNRLLSAIEKPKPTFAWTCARLIPNRGNKSCVVFDLDQVTPAYACITCTAIDFWRDLQ